MKRLLFSLCLLTTTTLSGCIIIDANNDDDPPNPWTTDISKKDAADLMEADPDTTPDYCASQGWYDDGVCDDFCYEPDADCETTDACQDSRDCPTDQFCGTTVGQCGGAGTCQDAPEACTEEYDPVCGCDGITYGNACSAAAAGASVLKDGPCEIPPPECEPADCGPAPGAPSQVCDDGSTAGPVCQAQADGTCGWTFTQCPTSKACGGLVPDGVDNTCGEGEYCHYDAQAMCGFADAQGTCQPTPEACDAVYDPVCGCDGQTYGNACSANAAGVSVQYDGECAEPPQQGCGGERADGTSGECPSGEYCHYELEDYCGFADAPGVCKQLPEACTDHYDPVCGCDGQTYGNGCYANAAGVSIEHTGECEGPAPATCGGFAGETCSVDEYCHYDAADMCGAADQQGTCEPKPEVCPNVYAPVCGCDGQSYGNECEANAAGTSVASMGECNGGTDPGYCGGIAGVTCPAGQFCKYDEQAMCGFADATGTCEPTPFACPEIYAPVCGCDGQTYSNDCFANAAGTSVQHDGACNSNGGGNSCGGFAGFTCGTDEYCHYEVDAMCGAADQQGTCKPKPQACTFQYDPVCGCDGMTYGNACEASSAGMSVQYTGECAP